MKVILSSNVKALGKKGDVVNVSDGYANNFLLKNKLAVPASAGNLNLNNQEKAAEARRIKEETAEAEDMARKLKDVEVVVKTKIGENGKTFGSISGKEISEQLSEMGFEIDKKKIELDAPIKTVGSYLVPVRLYKGVVGKINVKVVPNS